MALKDRIKELDALKEKEIRLSVPHRTVFVWMLTFFALFFILASLSTYFLLMVTVPIGAYVLYTYHWFFSVWRSFGYSRAIYVIILIAAVVLGLTVGRELRTLLWRLIVDFIG